MASGGRIIRNKRIWILVLLFFLSSINYVDRVALW